MSVSDALMRLPAISVVDDATTAAVIAAHSAVDGLPKDVGVEIAPAYAESDGDRKTTSELIADIQDGGEACTRLASEIVAEATAIWAAAAQKASWTRVGKIFAIGLLSWLVVSLGGSLIFASLAGAIATGLASYFMAPPSFSARYAGRSITFVAIRAGLWSSFLWGGLVWATAAAYGAGAVQQAFASAAMIAVAFTINVTQSKSGTQMKGNNE